MTDRASAISTEGLHPECAKRGYHRDGCRAMTDRASTEGLRAAATNVVDHAEDKHPYLRCTATDHVLALAAALRDTGPRPDSEIDAWPHKPYRCCSIHFHGTISEQAARLSTPRTETSENPWLASSDIDEDDRR